MTARADLLTINRASSDAAAEDALVSRKSGTDNKEKEMTTTKTAAKKTTARKAPARKAPAKTAAKKAPAKAPAKKAPATKSTSVDSGTKAAEAEAKRQARAQAQEVRRNEIVNLRDSGKSWEEIAKQLGIHQTRAHTEYLYATTERADVEATPARIKKERDAGSPWVQLAARYGITKGAAQKLYREAGADPHASYIGKGGRYHGHEEKIAHLKSEKAPAQPRKGRSTAPAGKSVFNDEVEKDDVIAKIDGKFIHHSLSEKMGGGVAKTKVAAGTVKVGKQKDGTRVVQFSDGDKTRTVALLSIVKVTAR